MAVQPPPLAEGARKRSRLRSLIYFIVAVAVAGTAYYLRKSANERRVAEKARQVQNEPQVAQQRAVAEARATLNIELLPDDGTFFPATADIDVGSLLYTVHVLGPAKARYYSEDAYLAGREGDLLIVRPIIEPGRPAGAAPQSYRSKQSRSAETKREEVKAQKKITREELAEKYAARTGR